MGCYVVRERRINRTHVTFLSNGKIGSGLITCWWRFDAGKTIIYSAARRSLSCRPCSHDDKSIYAGGKTKLSTLLLVSFPQWNDIYFNIFYWSSCGLNLEILWFFKGIIYSEIFHCAAQNLPTSQPSSQSSLSFWWCPLLRGFDSMCFVIASTRPLTLSATKCIHF